MNLYWSNAELKAVILKAVADSEPNSMVYLQEALEKAQAQVLPEDRHKKTFKIGARGRKLFDDLQVAYSIPSNKDGSFKLAPYVTIFVPAVAKDKAAMELKTMSKLIEDWLDTEDDDLPVPAYSEDLGKEPSDNHGDLTELYITMEETKEVLAEVRDLLKGVKSFFQGFQVAPPVESNGNTPSLELVKQPGPTLPPSSVPVMPQQPTKKIRKIIIGIVGIPENRISYLMSAFPEEDRKTVELICMGTGSNKLKLPKAHFVVIHSNGNKFLPGATMGKLKGVYGDKIRYHQNGGIAGLSDLLCRVVRGRILEHEKHPAKP